MKKKFTVLDTGITRTPWAVNKGGNIFTLLKGKWIQVPGRLKHISSGKAGVWGVNSAGNIYYRTGVSRKNRKGVSWTQIPGKLKQIDSGPRGVVCGVNAVEDIFCRMQITVRTPSGGKWAKVPGKLKYISCGDYGQWGVNKAGQIFFRVGYSRVNPLGWSWKRLPGRLTQIEAGKYGQVWGVNSAGLLFVRTGVSNQRPWGKGWKRVKTRKIYRHVSIGVGAVFGVSRRGIVYRTTPATAGKVYFVLFVYRFYLFISLSKKKYLVLFCHFVRVYNSSAIVQSTFMHLQNLTIISLCLGVTSPPPKEGLFN